jgi:HSP20 family protein
MKQFNSNFEDFFDGLFNSKLNSPFIVRTNTSRYLNEDNDEKYETNYTNDGAYLLFDVPGFNKNNLKVDLEEGVLFINGTRTYKINGEDITKKVSKQFNIGNEYNVEKIEATIHDGILTVFIPNYKKREKKRISLI